MALILNIETSSKVCSVAIGKGDDVIAIKENFEQSHASILAVMIKQVLNECNLGFSSLDAIAVSSGPGSYTGLRIGAATAKGLCYALSKPLIAVDSLQAMAIGLAAAEPFASLYCPVIDARRMEIFYGLYDLDGNMIQQPSPEILTEKFLHPFLNQYRIVIGGSGVDKCRRALSHPNIIFNESILPSASWMCSLSEKKYTLNMFSDVLSFEPDYLKPAYIISKS